MTAFTMNEAVARALGGMRVSDGQAARRRIDRRDGSGPAGVPVRRDSIEAGTFEERFFVAPAKGETDRMLRVARQALDTGRRLRRIERTGERQLSRIERGIAELTAGAVRVYEELLTLARLNQGRVFPSYDRLAHATGLGRATVARGLAILERIGFLARQRRFRRIATPNDAGPRYAQTSNVYRAQLPAAILKHLPRWLHPAPLPADQVQRETERRGDTTTMLASLTCRELATATVGGALGRMLAKLGAAVDRAERESHPDPVSLFQSFESGRTGDGSRATRPGLSATDDRYSVRPPSN